MEYPVFVIALGAVLAGFVQGLSGFAFGMVSMSIWAWTVEPRLAAVLAVFGGLTGQVIAAVTVRRGFDGRRLAPFVIGGLLGLPLGLWLLPRLDVALFKALLGTLLVTWCPLMLVGTRLPRIEAGGRLGDGAAGALGGLLGALGGFTGAIPTLWCTLRGFDKDAQRAVIQNFNLGMLAVTFASYVGGGMVTLRMLPMLALVAAAVLVPVLLGARVYVGLSEAAFRRVVMVLLTLAGIALLASALPVLWRR
ncbi:sulfite exporter TauE/SafE family protein [Azohydromonas lata]|uniref:Probable membrane transporter protein n=1 Tax=Azohydromonas lata TaxID=45677 RepID=A0ABU5ILH9_9BURK|nr:sulfite exporter TauE/SafE family protein [Azohydromonas lata]MDZ5459768.1 sulfite exporter TauE/SafE family protein [Azohydromonas lata]